MAAPAHVPTKAPPEGTDRQPGKSGAGVTGRRHSEPGNCAPIVAIQMITWASRPHLQPKTAAKVPLINEVPAAAKPSTCRRAHERTSQRVGRQTCNAHVL